MGLSLTTLAVRQGLGGNLGQSSGKRIITQTGNKGDESFEPDVLGGRSSLSNNAPFGKVLGKRVSRKPTIHARIFFGKDLRPTYRRLCLCTSWDGGER